MQEEIDMGSLKGNALKINSYLLFDKLQGLVGVHQCVGFPNQGPPVNIHIIIPESFCPDELCCPLLQDGLLSLEVIVFGVLAFRTMNL